MSKLHQFFVSMAGRNVYIDLTLEQNETVVEFLAFLILLK
jgi:hypothetical protein